MDRSGATAGPGTFVNAVIEAAGGTNLIQNPGWQSPDTETLIGLQPDIILTSFMGSKYAGVNDRTLQHAALTSKIQSLPRIDIPGKLWPCAGPGLVEAAEKLNHAMAKL
jgi:iron complex transport system substrate-binding protein